MSEVPPGDDDVLAQIERTRAWLETEAMRARVPRQPERRGRERRGLGFTARRSDDAERNHQIRQLVFSYLRDLPRQQLLLWIDGLWLGNATDTQLAMLAKTVATDQETEERKRSPKRRGRPRDTESPSDQDLRAKYRALQQELKPFSRAREDHFKPLNRRRAKGQRGADFKRVCRESPIGQRVNRAGLFSRFFDDPALGPGAMAAQLMHREYRQALMTFAQAAHLQATTAASTVRKDVSRTQAEQAEKLLKKCPSWRTMYDKLRQPLRPRSSA